MSKLAGFLKKTLEENQAGYKKAEKRKEQERINYKIDQEIKKALKQFEFELIEKYKEHRVVLQDYSKKLAAKELALSAKEETILQDEQNIKSKIIELSERESSIEEEEANREKSIKDAIKKYADKKKQELYIEAEKAKEKAKSDLEALQEYKTALHKTEFTIIDWLQRVDRKEREAFEEIRKGVEEYQQCNQAPPEEGFDFERKFAAALKQNGFENVVVTEETGDFGADILAEKDSVKYVIQCKYYTSSVGVKAVQQVFASKIHYSAHVAVVATNSVFTKSAKVLAEETGVILWNGLKVQEILESIQGST